MSFINLEQLDQENSLIDYHNTLNETLDSLANTIQDLRNPQICFVSDTNIAQLYLQQICEKFPQAITFILPVGEGAKNLHFANEVAEYLFSKRFCRQDLVIAVGGGVVTDLVGFVSSIYMRGIKFILIPTSLLGMADASVGGKTGINNIYGKNQLGVINDPYRIKVCSQFLQSLDKRNFLNGLAEIIKIAACFDRKLFERLECYDYNYLMDPNNQASLLDIIKYGINLKLSIVTEDKYEQNIRKILNYGHTIGHAVEFASQGKLLHGECVSIGMVLANILAKEHGIDTSSYENRIRNVLLKYELPIEIPEYVNIQDVLKYLQFDKKVVKHEINFVFIQEIGKHKFNTTPIKMDIIKKILVKSCVIVCQDIRPSKPIHGSKSITNRVLLLSSLSEGISTLGNFYDSDDTKAMLNSLQDLRLCEIQTHSKHNLILEGCQGQFYKKEYTINVKESGTCARFLLPIAALIGNVTIIGAQRIYERPIQEMVEALNLNVVYLQKEGQLPFKVIDGQFGKHIKIKSQLSSQFVSGILMSAPYFPNDETLIEIIDCNENETIVSESYIEMTIQLMNIYGVKVERISKTKFLVRKGVYKAQNYDIEPDATALSYDLLHIGLNGGSIETKKISKLQGDAQFLDVIEQMGMQVVREQGFYKIIKNQDLKPQDVNCINFSDTFISLALLMSSIEGQCIIKGIENQRVKECDRIKAVTENLIKVGVVCLQQNNEILVRGKKYQKYNGYRKDVIINTYNDHRIAMAFSILGGHFEKVQYQYRIIIDNKDCVRKTFPDFYNHIQSLGLQQQALTYNQEQEFLYNYQYYKEPLYIIGMRGAGKSTLSQYICKQLGFEYISIDNLISNNINEFVTKYGWEQFRKCEKEQFIQILLKYQKNVVVDCGGGIIEDEQIQQLLIGKNVIWIEKDINELIEDLQSQNRPQIGNVMEIYNRRKSIYQRVSKYIFTLPSRKYIQKITSNYDITRYYQRINELYLHFIKCIQHLNFPRNKIYVSDTNFACIFYEELTILDHQKIHFINRNHNLLEVRMDKIENIQEQFDQIRQQIYNIKFYLDIPIIFTLRTKSQGGFYNGTQYIKIIEQWQNSFIGDYFDIEMDQFNNVMISQNYNNSIILSQHLFEKTEKLQIIEFIDRMKYISEHNPNIICLLKLAIHQDAYPSELTYQEISKLFMGMKFVIPYLVVSMGPNSQLYRTLNKFMVPLSCLTPTAVGQCTIQQLRSIRSLANFEITQNYHIFGDDLSLSRSDLLHQKYFDQLNQQHNKFYTKVSIKKIEQAKPYINNINFQGASITMPFKEEVQQYLTEQSIEAQIIGAVNCIIKYENQLIGFNTDWWGMFWPIFTRFPKNMQKCLILGNGGTAKTAIFVASKLFLLQVYLYGRNPQKVEALAKQYKVDFMRQSEKTHKFDLIISTIPPGAELPLCEEWFDEKTIVFVANQGDDPLLKKQNSISGREMFEAQAIGQVHLFNGK
ncbi:unnamed protein product [Paramecium primaurelia]|uniref:3-phosphoshikimate 1-carboxyvinyltransferase n=1 Tax=Paramecium primaurelia TaxID=5886 RepID=A0A8S1K8F3_PARPR|nr:unnamed protein product [Paramecium primaurelia]